MGFMVCWWPQSLKGNCPRPHLCKLAWHGPWPVRKRFIRDLVWRGRSKPGCRTVGSVIVVWSTTEADDQSSLCCVTVLTGVMSDHSGRRDASRGGGCSETWNTNRKSRLDDVAIAAIWVLCLIVIVSQQVCGFEYTSKLSRMFTDVSFCADITATFNEYLNESPDRALPHAVSLSILQVRAIYCITDAPGWLGSRVVSVLDSGAEGPGSNRSGDAVG